jgi:A/G-specific adenine glycosylase
MLQQTRVEAVTPYYWLFLKRFPSIESLAAAPENDVLKAWSGLGYYSRARNLHRAAKRLAIAGIPASYDEVLSLQGVGPYTAAAIASIALGLPHAAVDGNVIRVVSRLTNDPSEITAPDARRRFAGEAGRLLDRRRPGDFNQAMMELGATLCLPRTPNCAACPVVKFCAARASGSERELPVKLKKRAPRNVALELAILERKGSVFLVQRSALERRLADFWELPAKNLFPRAKGAKLAEFRHRIVDDNFRVTVWHITDQNFQPANPHAGNWVDLGELDRIPLTTVTRKALAARLS